MTEKNKNQIRDLFWNVVYRYTNSEYHTLSYQYEKWKNTNVLEGIKILDATPLFYNTFLKYIPLLAAGADLTIATNDNIPYHEDAVSYIDFCHIPHVHNATSGEYDCILDCGGIHSNLNPKYGFVELTKSGYYHYQNSEKPVIFVDDSKIKTIETCLGTGEGFLRAMKNLNYTDFYGKEIVIFGYGKVGKGIAHYSQKAGAKITIIDKQKIGVPDDFTYVSAFNVNAVKEAVKSAWCVVTSTGIKGAMIGNGASDVLKNACNLIAAMGVEDEWLDSLPKNRILNNGNALNFMLDEPTSLKYIDPTMALSNASVLELVTKSLDNGIQKINDDVQNEYWNVVMDGSLISEEIKEMNF